MSLSAAISNALTGLTAASRGTEVVASNLANNLTPGYARREVSLSPRTYGGGVQIDGVQRTVTASLLADNRLSQGRVANSTALAGFYNSMEKSIGTVNDGNSLNSLIAGLDAKLIAASSQPNSEIRLAEVLSSAKDLAGKINDVARDIQSARTNADHGIAADVDHLNTTLEQIAKLNRQVVTTLANGHDASSLMDARQKAVDSIADIVAIQEVPRENGRISLFTKGGAVLLDGMTPSKIGFVSSGQVSPQDAISDGTLSTLSIDGEPLSILQLNMFAGGSIAAQFEIRDRLAPELQTQIDAVARDLYDRFSDPSVDPSISPGDHGLFTDKQQSFDGTSELGLANRLEVANSVDPANGGELWRLRAGIGAAATGNLGDSSLLIRMSEALNQSRTSSSTGVSQSPRTLSVFASELSSFSATARLRAESALSQDNAQFSALKSALLSEGVDTDREMENLLALERAYAANAKVFQAANDMLDNILRMT